MMQMVRCENENKSGNVMFALKITIEVDVLERVRTGIGLR